MRHSDRGQGLENRCLIYHEHSENANVNKSLTAANFEERIRLSPISFSLSWRHNKVECSGPRQAEACRTAAIKFLERSTHLTKHVQAATRSEKSRLNPSAAQCRRVRLERWMLLFKDSMATGVLPPETLSQAAPSQEWLSKSECLSPLQHNLCTWLHALLKTSQAGNS